MIVALFDVFCGDAMRWLGLLSLLSLSPFLTGCAKGTEQPSKTPSDSMREIAEVYKYLRSEKLEAPASLKNLEPYIDTLGSAWAKLESGDVVLRYRVHFAPSGSGAKSVLAYEKNVPTGGGSVLLRDGTIMEMTAAEFKAAPK